MESSTPVGHKRELQWATWRGAIVVVGLSIYVASFFLWAVEDFRRLTGPLYGWFCAEFVLVSPFSQDGRSLLHEKTVEYFSILGSGLINPLFLITFFLQLSKVRPRAVIVLRNLTILMIPLCWVVFYYERLYPREGHILWTAGMLLTLFGMSSVELNPPREQRA